MSDMRSQYLRKIQECEKRYGLEPFGTIEDRYARLQDLARSMAEGATRTTAERVATKVRVELLEQGEQS